MCDERRIVIIALTTTEIYFNPRCLTDLRFEPPQQSQLNHLVQALNNAAGKDFGLISPSVLYSGFEMHFQRTSTLVFLISFAIIVLHEVNSEGTEGKSQKDKDSLSVDSLNEKLELAGVKWKADESSTVLRPSSTHTAKMGQSETQSKTRGFDSEETFNVGELRNSALRYGKYVLEQALSMDFRDLFNPLHSMGKSSYGGAFYKKRSAEGANEEKPHHENAFIRWAVSLFSVEGESLAEFLRVYRVHVLYDLVFYFFKWLFFAYVALLIP
ncbi:unnamed protein product [Allacma fusca]|uniref:Uncharacterized protein n=1 Tax=Allacma fusca TaxID=39272 RepID=A0A8J2P064_9HEXA|nr:unnamed protein product [Allacma fusca]